VDHSLLCGTRVVVKANQKLKSLPREGYRGKAMPMRTRGATQGIRAAAEPGPAAAQARLGARAHASPKPAQRRAKAPAAQGELGASSLSSDQCSTLTVLRTRGTSGDSLAGSSVGGDLESCLREDLAEVRARFGTSHYLVHNPKKLKELYQQHLKVFEEHILDMVKNGAVSVLLAPSCNV